MLSLCIDIIQFKMKNWLNHVVIISRQNKGAFVLQFQSRLEIEEDKIIIYQKSLKNGIPDVKFTRVRTGENTLNMVR